MFYKCPKPGQRVRWSAQQPNPVIRYGEGELTFLFTSARAIAAEQWLSAPVEVGLFSLDQEPVLTAAGAALPKAIATLAGTLPVLVVALAGQVMATPVCLLELPDEQEQIQWLDWPETLCLRLVLLEPDAEEPTEVARVVAVRRFWHPGWEEAEQRLRRGLVDLLIDAGEGLEGEVQWAGRQLVDVMGAQQLLEDCQLRLSEHLPVEGAPLRGPA